MSKPDPAQLTLDDPEPPEERPDPTRPADFGSTAPNLVPGRELHPDESLPY